MFAKRNWFYLIISPPLLFNKRSNFIILSLFNGGAIYISHLYEFLSRKGTFPSLGHFSNNQKLSMKPFFSGCKILFHQIYCPWKQFIGYTCPLFFFISTKIFLAREWLWVFVWGSAQNQSLAWKFLVLIKNHPLTLVHNRVQVYAAPNLALRENIQGGNVLFPLTLVSIVTYTYILL